jgi:hypothetical protein
MSTRTGEYAPRSVTSIGRREAQVWLRKRLDYERLLAALRRAHAAKQAGESGTNGRGVAA